MRPVINPAITENMECSIVKKITKCELEQLYSLVYRLLQNSIIATFCLLNTTIWNPIRQQHL